MDIHKYAADLRPAPDLFRLDGRVALITGGAGLLGQRHAEAIASVGGVPVLVDIDQRAGTAAAAELIDRFGVPACAIVTQISDAASVREMLMTVMERYGRVDILINNAANNPKVENPLTSFSRLESFPDEAWADDLAVGLTGAYLCSKFVGTRMAQEGGGVIVNISSEYGMIAPDQRLYRSEGVAEEDQPVKPITYTVVKSGLAGMTKYLATYWATKGVRVNTLTVGGVYNGQPEDFESRAAERIPLGRMARPDEYRGAIIFLASDASSFMTGANLVVDGGKSTW